MDTTNALHTHLWSDGTTPRQITQDGKTILHHRCLRCGRDFTHGVNGAGWQAAYIGIFKVELLADCVSQRWLREECPRRLLPEDDVSRAMRRS